MAACSSPGPVALHSDLLLLDQPGGTVVRRVAAALPGPRRVLLARRTHHRTAGLDQDLECQRPALQVDQDRRSDHRPHLPLLLTHLRTGTLVWAFSGLPQGRCRMDPLVLAAGTALVGAMVTDGWQQARTAVVAWWRKVHPGRADAVGAELDTARAQVLPARE